MERFEKISKLETKDNTTGLVWRSDFARKISWQEAQDYAASLGGDWRLPAIKELISLVDYSRCNPATDFPGMPSECFWSSSSYAGNVFRAWLVYFSSGNVTDSDKTSSGYSARCVRGGAAKEEK